MKTLGESQGKFYPGKNKIYVPENDIERAAKKLREEKEFEAAAAKEKELLLAKQQEIQEKAERLELIPLGNKVILSPYPRNPYRQIMSEGGIITDYNGEFFNPDSGETDKAPELVGCAKIVEVGPECKYVKPGDDVYYSPNTCYPLPFMSMGYRITSEPQLLSVLNEGLKKRFKMEE